MTELSVKRTEISVVHKKLLSECSLNSSKYSKIHLFNKVCESLVDKGVDMQISLLVTHLSQAGMKISKQSIYNKQGGKNPYRVLFDLWAEYSTIKKSKASYSAPTVSKSDIFTGEDLSKIDDPVLRYRVSLLYGEVKGLKQQNDMLRQIKDMRAIKSIPSNELELQDSESVLLDSYEVDLIRSLFKGNANLGFDDDGKLVAGTSIRKGTSLSSEGLNDALNKILRSYERD